MTVTSGEKSARDRFVSLAFCWGEILFEITDRYEILFAGGITEVLFGCPPESLVGRNFLDLMGIQAQQVTRAVLSHARHHNGRIQDLYVSVERFDRRTQICQIAGYYAGPEAGSPVGRYFLSLKLMPNAQLERTMSYADGFCDADSFCDMANEALARRRDAKLSLISIPDLQNLFGEMSRGEQRNIRLAISSFLHAQALDQEEAGTMGLGKYALVHADATNIDALRDELAALLASITEKDKVDVRTATVTGQDDVDPEDLAKGIVFAINQFKESAGHNLTLSSLNANFSELAEEAVKTVSLFRNVVAHSNFSIVFQPIVSLKNGSVHHYEVLSRFQGKFGESPYRYICFAEETGLISSFDFAVMLKTVDWVEKNIKNAKKPVIRMAVNMSGQSLLDPGYRQRVDELLGRKPWIKDYLIFELTESARVEDLQTADLYIQHLRGKGVPVCLDDFGAGAASFNYLSAMAVDVVKLDGAAVANTIGTARGRAFMKAMGSFCRELKVETIGEMIDSKEKMVFLQSCDIDFGQGYLFGKGELTPQDIAKQIAPLFG
jgi:EAL domain-containing protein (putative c-di-GMP-specific phosphodiesterase class I)